MKKRLWIIGGVVILTVLGLIGWWLWKMGEISEIPPDRLVLIVNRGAVRHLKAGEDIEKTAKSNMELKAGDRIRTMATSSASIQINGRAEIRLDQETTVKIVESNPEKVQLKWQLISGRLWALLLPTIDPEEFFKAEVGVLEILAQGSSFAVSKENQEEVRIYVDRGAVKIAQEDLSEKWLVDREWMNGFENEENKSWEDWITENQQADERAKEAFVKWLLTEHQVKGMVASDHWLRFFAEGSEKIQSWLKKEDCGEVYARKAKQKLNVSREQLKKEKKGAAMQGIKDWQRQLVQEMDEEKRGCVQNPLFKKAIGQGWLGLYGVLPEEEEYPLKLEMEEIYQELWVKESTEYEFIKAVFADARLDEWAMLMCVEGERYAELKTAVEQGIRRVQEQAELAGNDTVGEVLKNRSKGQVQRMEKMQAKGCASNEKETPQEDMEDRDIIEG